MWQYLIVVLLHSKLYEIFIEQFCFCSLTITSVSGHCFLQFFFSNDVMFKVCLGYAVNLNADEKIHFELILMFSLNH